MKNQRASFRSEINSLIFNLILNSWISLSKWITSDVLFLKVYYFLKMREFLNIGNPKTYTQKIQWLKLHNTNSLYSMMVDKYQVREIIKDKLGEEYSIPLLGVWNSFDQIDFAQLPEQFVLKTTHDSGTVIICNNLSTFDKISAKRKLEKSLKRNYFYKSREYPYKFAIPRIIAEKYMHDETQTELTDYKFFCFQGVPEFLQITTINNGEKLVCYFDMEFNPMPFYTGTSKADPGLFHKPDDFEKMIEIARLLSQNIIHVRIDLYYINKRIYFGEYTFHNNGGIVNFSPSEWNNIIGEMIDLPN